MTDTNTSKTVSVDWIIHYVFDNENNKTAAHTHGLDKHGMKELEVNLPLEKNQMLKLVNTVAYELVSNNLVIDEEYYFEANTIFNCPILLKKTVPVFKSDKLGKYVLRVIFPDENGNFPWDDGCLPYYKDQI